jgi:hypothetical protein
LLDLQVVAFDAVRGLWVQPLPTADARAFDAACAAHAQDPSAADMPAAAFRPDLPAGAHAARVCARIRALASVQCRREDSEGISRIDVEAQSDARWKSWCRKLTSEQQTCLSIWRSGAISTPTRRWAYRGGADAHRRQCPFCSFELASARHWWAECPHFGEARRALEQEYRIMHGWWAAQPRCTAKSGWITVDAAADRRRRVDMQLAACRLGLTVLQGTREWMQDSG